MAFRERVNTAIEYCRFKKGIIESLTWPRIYACGTLNELVDMAISHNTTTISATPLIQMTGFNISTQERRYEYKIALTAEVWGKVKPIFHRDSEIDILKNAFQYVTPDRYRFSVDREWSDLMNCRLWAGVVDDEEKLPVQQKWAYAKTVRAAEQWLKKLQGQLPGIENRGVQSSSSDMTLGQIGAFTDREELLSWLETLKQSK